MAGMSQSGDNSLSGKLSNTELELEKLWHPLIQLVHEVGLMREGYLRQRIDVKRQLARDKTSWSPRGSFCGSSDSLEDSVVEKEALKDLERCLDKQQDLFQILQADQEKESQVEADNPAKEDASGLDLSIKFHDKLSDLLQETLIGGQLSSELTDSTQRASDSSIPEETVAAEQFSAQAAAPNEIENLTPHWSGDMGLAPETLGMLIARHEPLIRQLGSLLLEQTGINDSNPSQGCPCIGDPHCSNSSTPRQTSVETSHSHMDTSYCHHRENPHYMPHWSHVQETLSSHQPSELSSKEQACETTDDQGFHAEQPKEPTL